MPNFPIITDQYNDLGDGKQMETTVHLTIRGQLHVEVHTWTRSYLVGFTGGVIVSLLDNTETVIGATDLHTYGVDAKTVFWKPSSRTDYFDQWFDKDTLDRTERLAIWQAHTPKDRFFDIVNETILKGKTLAEALIIFNSAFE